MRRVDGRRRGRDLRAVMALLGTVAWLSILLPAHAQEFQIARQHSAWGRFPVGSWQRVRITTQTLDADGKVETVAKTDRKSTLTAIDASGFTLRIEATVEVAGREFEAPVQTVRYGFSGEPIASDADEKITLIEPSTVTIEGLDVACRVGQLQRHTDEGEVTTRLFYSDSMPPYILRRETKIVEPSSGKQVVQEASATLFVGMPLRVKQEIHTAAVQTVVRSDIKGIVTRTLRWLSSAVPGELVSASTKELDSQGRVLRRSLVELVDYHVAP